eukprot:scaffold813_cov313-Prasinococcus_capsulatus_cf.AAC.4
MTPGSSRAPCQVRCAAWRAACEPPARCSRARARAAGRNYGGQPGGPRAADERAAGPVGDVHLLGREQHQLHSARGGRRGHPHRPQLPLRR